MCRVESIRRIIAVAAVMLMFVISSVWSANAACSSWAVYYKGTPYCQSPTCGPGAVLETKYQVQKLERYCNVNGQQKRETKTITKKLGCCN